MYVHASFNNFETILFSDLCFMTKINLFHMFILKSNLKVLLQILTLDILNLKMIILACYIKVIRIHVMNWLLASNVSILIRYRLNLSMILREVSKHIRTIHGLYCFIPNFNALSLHLFIILSLPLSPKPCLEI